MLCLFCFYWRGLKSLIFKNDFSNTRLCQGSLELKSCEDQRTVVLSISLSFPPNFSFSWITTDGSDCLVVLHVSPGPALVSCLCHYKVLWQVNLLFSALISHFPDGKTLSATAGAGVTMKWGFWLCSFLSLSLIPLFPILAPLYKVCSPDEQRRRERDWLEQTPTRLYCIPNSGAGAQPCRFNKPSKGFWCHQVWQQGPS